MMNKMFYLIVFLSLGFLTDCRAMPRPIPLGTDTYYYGYVDQGRKFGVEIGQSRDDARQILVGSGFEHRGVADCSYKRIRDTIDCQSSDDIDLYKTRRTFRHGELYIFFADGEVTAMVWSFYLLPTIDW